jgi:hypothetical protein
MSCDDGEFGEFECDIVEVGDGSTWFGWHHGAGVSDL